MSDTDTQQNTNLSNNQWLDEIKFNNDGLIPAIAQDKTSGDILMMAWMNKEALALTAESKTAVYYSRSRGKLWHKGETSGHTQIVHDIHLDCDADVIVLTVTQIGDIACHTGRKSCFYRKLNLSGDAPSWETVAPVLKDPNDIYGSGIDSGKHSGRESGIDSRALSSGIIDNAMQTANGDVKGSGTASNELASNNTVFKVQQLSDTLAATVLAQLDNVLAERKKADAESSYVASLYAKGINKILEKVGEEAVETVISAKDLAFASSSDVKNGVDVDIATNDKQALEDDLIYEVADVWFHTLVTLAWFDLKSDRVLAELARRFGLSGIEEKNSRSS